MKRSIIGFFIILTLMIGAICGVEAVTDPNDTPDSKDHPLITRMTGFYIDDYEEKEFDQYTFVNQGKQVTVEGHKYYICYYIIDTGGKVPGEIEIVRNHTNAIKKIGGKVLFENSQNAYLKVEKGGMETWIHVKVFNQGEGYRLNIIEKKGMVQQVEADANALAQSLSESGKVAVYGIYFDTGKAEIKPESEPTLKEIAILLQQNPKLKLYVTGHTDNVGELGLNMKLSQARAEAVVKALTTQYKVAANRLYASGVGPLAPVTTNKTEEGRAKNRRVELVEQ